MVAGPWVESIDLGDEDPAMGIRVISGPGIIQPVIYKSCAPAWGITNAHPPSCAVAKVGTTIFYYTGEPVPGGAEYRLLLPSGAPMRTFLLHCTISAPRVVQARLNIYSAILPRTLSSFLTWNLQERVSMQKHQAWLKVLREGSVCFWIV